MEIYFSINVGREHKYSVYFFCFFCDKLDEVFCNINNEVRHFDNIEVKNAGGIGIEKNQQDFTDCYDVFCSIFIPIHL
jgi:hypothetical protein